MTADREQTRRDEWIDPHDWLYREIVNGRQIVSCRRCGKFASYRLIGYKPQPPRSECR